MTIPVPNVLVTIDAKGKASVEVAGVKMAGVLRVSSEFGMEAGSVVIEVHPRFVRYEQRVSSIADAQEQLRRRLADLDRLSLQGRQEMDALTRENDDLKRQLAQRPRVRVKAGRS
jgi:hypothetical protein